MGLAAAGLMAVEQVEAQEKQVGDLADPFTLTNLVNEEPFDLNDLEGSIVVLDFFFYW